MTSIEPDRNDQPMPSRTATAALLLAICLAGCVSGDTDQRVALNQVLVDMQELHGVEAVGGGRAGGATDLVITVRPGVTADRAEDLLDQGVRRVWHSDLEPLTTIRVTVTAGERPDRGALPTDLLYEAQLERAQNELVERYGPRGAER